MNCTKLYKINLCPNFLKLVTTDKGKAFFTVQYRRYKKK